MVVELAMGVFLSIIDTHLEKYSHKLDFIPPQIQT